MRLILCLFVLMTACSPKSGEGIGFGGKIKVSLELENKKIKDIVILEQNETDILFDRAFPILKERIIAANSPLVDNVSGASFSSFGIKKAVADALANANIDSPTISFNSAPEKPADTTIDSVDTDLVVVGGGAAGMATALEAYENGITNIILVEKLDILGGNGKFASTLIGLVDSEAQKAYNVTDSADEFYNSMLKANLGDDTNRLRLFADYSVTTDKWLREKGIALDYLMTNANGWGRNLKVAADVYAGDYVQRGLEAALKNTGVDIRTGTAGLDLIMDGDTVTGVLVKNNNNQSYVINAKAVMIATGGFSANKELIARYNTDYTNFYTSNQEKNLGDFVPVFEKNGMALSNMNIFFVFSHTSTKNRAPIGVNAGDVDFVLVNKNGERFTKEKGNSPDQYANIILQQPDRIAYYIFDKVSRDSNKAIRKYPAIEGTNITDLAQKLKLNPTTLAKTLEDYNKTISGDMEDPFGRTPYHRVFDMNNTLYAFVTSPAVHQTRGGVVVNAKGEVQSTNQTSIKGLYSAGEATSFISAGAHLAAIVFGRAAGDSIYEYLNSNNEQIASVK